MAITLVGTIATDTSIGTASTDRTWPTMQQGDVTYVLVARNYSAAPTLADGYSLVGANANSTSRNRIFRKVQGATPDTTVSVAGPGVSSQGQVMFTFVLRGVDNTTPEDATATLATGGSSSQSNPAAITTTTSNAWVVVFTVSNSNDTSINYPSGYTNGTLGNASTTNACASSFATKEIAVAGVEDPPNWTNFPSNQWSCITLAIRAFAKTGTIDATEGQDVAAFSGTAIRIVQGPIIVTEAQDTAAFTGQDVHVHGVLSPTEAQGVFAGTGTIKRAGTMPAVETQDVAAFAGQDVHQHGHLIVTEGQDVVVVTGQDVHQHGHLIVTEGQDVASMVGEALYDIRAVLAAVETQDGLTASGAVHTFKAFYFKNAAHSGGGGLSLQEGGSIGTSITATGWRIGTGHAGEYCRMDGGTELVSGWTGSPPSATLSTDADDCFRTENAYSGRFASGTWPMTIGCKAAQNPYDANVRFGVRLFRSSDPDGVGATQIATQNSTLFITSTTAYSSAYAPFAVASPVDLLGEYLFVQVYIAPLNAASFVGSDVRIAVGSSDGWGLTTRPFIPIYHGALAATEAQDTAYCIGSIGAQVFGVVVAVEAQDIFAGVGVYIAKHFGTLAASETQDIGAFSGTRKHQGTVAATEGQDTFAGVGKFRRVGTMAVTEAPDVARLWNKHNLFVYSEEFENNAWNNHYDTSPGLTVATNVIAAPDGTMTADKLEETATETMHRRGQVIHASRGQLRRASFYALAGERTFARVWTWAGGDTSVQTFNLSTGAVEGTLNPTAVAEPGGWWRCAFDVPAPHSNMVVGPALGFGMSELSWLGTAGYGIYIWGALLTYGPIQRDYDKTVATPLDPLYGVVVAGTFAPSEAQDVAALVGRNVPRYYGPLVVTEAPDVFYGFGGGSKLGTITAVEEQDTFAAVGVEIGRHTGTLSVTEIGDGLIAYGNSRHTGTMASTEAQDAFAAVGNSRHYGTLAAVETQDTARLWNPHNLVTYSEQLETWNGNQAFYKTVITPNAAVAPDGTMTAEYVGEVTEVDSYFVLEKGVGAGVGQLRRFAIHAKAGGRNFVRIFTANGIDNSQAVYNLTTGAIVYANPIKNASMENKGNGWWRCFIDTLEPHTALYLGPHDGVTGLAGNGPYNGTAGLGVYLWGGSLTFGPDAKDYDKTTNTILSPLYGVVVAGALVAAEAPDVFAATGIARQMHTGALVATDAPDTFVAAGFKYAIHTGTVAATEGADVFTAEGYDSGVGTMAAVEQQDVFAGVGTHTHLGTFHATEGQDVALISGQAVRRFGTLSVTEAKDVALFSGQSARKGVLAVTESADSFLASGLVLEVSGSITATDGQDVALFVGGKLDAAGTLVATEAQDALVAVGESHGLRYGHLNVVEAEDLFVAGGYTFRTSVGLPALSARATSQRLKVTVSPAGRRVA